MAIKNATTIKEALVNLINKDNGLSLQASALVLAAPAVVDGKGAFDTLNTTVLVTGADTTALPGEVTVTYTRQSVKNVMALSNWAAESGTAATAEGVATAVTGLVKETITSVPIEDGSYTVTASLMDSSDADYSADYPWKVVLDFSKNYVLCDTMQILVQIKAESLDQMVTTTELSGFTHDDVSKEAPTE